MKLQPTLIDARTSENTEIKPPVKCFCCWDSGRAANEFLTEFVELPASGNFLPYICKRFDCEAGAKLIAAYEKSDQERNAAWQKLLDKDPTTPKFMSQREFQANWSTALPATACENMHQWAHKLWVDRCVKNVRSPQFQTMQVFAQAVSEREILAKEIEQAIADSPIDLTPNLENFLRYCRERDGVEYLSIQALPTADYKVLIAKIRKVAA